MARQGYKRTNGNGQENERARELRVAMGGGSETGQWELDPQLLAVLVAHVTAAGAAVQFGTNRERTALTIKVWSEGFPTSRTCNDVAEANRVIAATAGVFVPKTDAFIQLRAWLEEYWKQG